MVNSYTIGLNIHQITYRGILYLKGIIARIVSFSSILSCVVNQIICIIPTYFSGVDIKDLSETYTGSKKEIFYFDNDKKENCNCTVQPEKKQSKIKNEQQIQTMIEFENNLQNIVYVKSSYVD